MKKSKDIQKIQQKLFAYIQKNEDRQYRSAIKLMIKKFLRLWTTKQYCVDIRGIMKAYFTLEWVDASTYSVADDVAFAPNKGVGDLVACAIDTMDSKMDSTDMALYLADEKPVKDIIREESKKLHDFEKQVNELAKLMRVSGERLWEDYLWQFN